jgi:hypothetical protein
MVDLSASETTALKPVPTAQIREGIGPGTGLWFYDCPECPCDFGTMGSREKAEREAAGHDAEHHAATAARTEGN